jgi:sugar lactone lactonase YvrE
MKIRLATTASGFLMASAIVAIFVSLLIAGTPGSPGDTTADIVLGQGDFIHNVPNLVDPKGIHLPDLPFTGPYVTEGWVAIDARASSHHLYVSDYSNNRVLGWLTANGFANGAPADLVIGQPDFLSYTQNNGGESASSMYGPSGLAVDGSGNLYVGDSNNGRVLQYDDPFAACHGTFPCVAGPAIQVFGACGSFTGGTCVGSPSADSLAKGVSGVWFDGSGNLYVADALDNRVLEYLAPFTGGAHSGTPGFPGDTTADAVFGESGSFSSTVGNLNADGLTFPTGGSVDSNGNLFVADFNNHRVLEYLAPFAGGMHSGTPGFPGDTTADVVFGQAGDFNTNNGGTTAATFGEPVSVVIDSSDDVYVADASNNRVLEFNAPVGLTPSANMVFGQEGLFDTQTCHEDDANQNQPRPSADTLCFPEGTALDPGNGNLFVIDGAGNRMLEYDDPLAGGGGTPGTPGSAGDTTADRVIGQGNFNHSIANFIDASGFGNGSCCGTFDFNGSGVTVDEHSTPHHFYAADFFNNRVLAWNDVTALQNGAPADRVFGQPDFFSHLCNLGVNDGMLPATNTPTADTLCSPVGVFADNSGNLWVADDGNQRVLEYLDPFASGGGTPGTPGSAGDSTADLVLGQSGFTSVQILDTCNLGTDGRFCFRGTEAVAVDNVGNAWVVDPGGHRVLEFNAPLSDGEGANKVFGQKGSFTTNVCNIDGSVSADSLCEPAGVAVDSGGNLYLSDEGNSRVLEFDNPLAPGGGTPGVPGSAGDTTADRVFGQNGSFTSNSCLNLGPPTPDDFVCNGVEQLALDHAGDLFAADRAGSRVLEFFNPLAKGGGTPGMPGSAGDTTGDRVFGQFGSFAHDPCNSVGPLNPDSSGPPSADNLCFPVAEAVDPGGNVYISDFKNSRVLKYLNPGATQTPTPTPTATPTPSPGRISVNKKSLSLFAHPNATASASITITNKGSGPLTANVTSPSHSPPFTELDGGNGIVIGPGGAHDVTIVYSPTSKGSTKDRIAITSDDPTQMREIKVKIKGKSR